MNSSNTLIIPDYSVQIIRKGKNQPVALSELKTKTLSSIEIHPAENKIPEEERFFERSFYGFWRVR